MAVLALLTPGQQVRAELNSARRYIDPQGVEMIQDRATAVRQLQPVTLPAWQSGKTAAAMQITPAGQARMDRDRVAILEQELQKEVTEYQTALKMQLSTESLNEHRHNIIALNAELRRSTPVR